MIWLSASYHFPSTYSLRVPTSSASSTVALPAPGPGTVKLAMIRSGIELFGEGYVKGQLFRPICQAQVQVKPPESVCITQQILKGFKHTREGNGIVHSAEAPFNRSVACAKGEFTLSLSIQEEYQDDIESLLWNIGYWGQASSFATCTSIDNQAPRPGEVAAPMPQIVASSLFGKYYCCFMTDFSRTEVDWSELLTDRKIDSFIIKRLYI